MACIGAASMALRSNTDRIADNATDRSPSPSDQINPPAHGIVDLPVVQKSSILLVALARRSREFPLLFNDFMQCSPRNNTSAYSYTRGGRGAIVMRMIGPSGRFSGV
jgi:hypothetical protein